MKFDTLPGGVFFNVYLLFILCPSDFSEAKISPKDFASWSSWVSKYI